MAIDRLVPSNRAPTLPCMEVPHEKQTLDNPNPIARFAQRARFKRLVLPLLKDGASTIRYCGPEGLPTAVSRTRLSTALVPRAAQDDRKERRSHHHDGTLMDIVMLGVP